MYSKMYLIAHDTGDVKKNDEKHETKIHSPEHGKILSVKVRGRC